MMLRMTTPPGGRRRRADAERSIASILDAAVELFSHDPAASMSDIAYAAGVGRVTLYAHFPSREALLEAATERALSETITALDTARLDEGPAVDALARVIRTGWEILDRHRGLLGVVGALAPDRLRSHHAEVLDRLDHLIARGQAEGRFRDDLPRDWLVSVAYSLIHTAAQEVNAGRLAAADANDVLVATIVGALAPPD